MPLCEAIVALKAKVVFEAIVLTQHRAFTLQGPTEAGKNSKQGPASDVCSMALAIAFRERIASSASTCFLYTHPSKAYE